MSYEAPRNIARLAIFGGVLFGLSKLAIIFRYYNPPIKRNLLAPLKFAMGGNPMALEPGSQVSEVEPIVGNVDVVVFEGDDGNHVANVQVTPNRARKINVVIRGERFVKGVTTPIRVDEKNPMLVLEALPQGKPLNKSEAVATFQYMSDEVAKKYTGN